MMPFVLDQIDLKILNVMQKDASLSSAELASRVGLSQSPCWRRIQRLRDEGYIKSVVALLDDEKLGINMYIFAQLKMRTLDDDERERFRHEVDKIPEVLECWTVFGDTDCMLKVVAPDVKWYQDFIFYVLLKLPGVIDISSIVTLTDTKKQTALPLTIRQFSPSKGR
ncbi:Lrp/AsnC family transcriptional regulator [Brevundimonas sp.]|uniref:Lrp/AsnC family transcriptional regulator n=1 Tax=Brevundimonas sp. TaxID=1871086 RepID=UPI0025C25726|nr:Lrp/AsnC family transcriptional regulator [Brevundimonas sp.]